MKMMRQIYRCTGTRHALCERTPLVCVAVRPGCPCPLAELLAPFAYLELGLCVVPDVLDNLRRACSASNGACVLSSCPTCPRSSQTCECALQDSLTRYTHRTLDIHVQAAASATVTGSSRMAIVEVPALVQAAQKLSFRGCLAYWGTI